MIDAVFSDIDGTICFHRDIHGIREAGPGANGEFFTIEPGSNEKRPAWDVSVTGYKVYLDLETCKLANELSDLVPLVYVTGGREASIRTRAEYLSFRHGVILESGGLILDGNYEVNRQWWDLLQPERSDLLEIRASLESAGWNIDGEGRTSAIRVRAHDNTHKTFQAFETLCHEIILPDGLKKTINLGNLDIILKSAGKDNAVKYWAETHNIKLENAAGIGDDINDICFLRLTGKKYILASAYPELAETAHREGWYISKKGHFSGINEILRVIIRDECK